MNKLYFLGLSLLATSLSFASFGQAQKSNDKKNQTHFITGIGGSYVNIIDEGISPLLYDGSGGSVILGHFQEKMNNLNASSVKFDFNNPSSSISNAEMYTFRLEGHFQRYWKVSNLEEKKLKLRPGFDLSAKWALRQHLNFTNNSQHIETRFSVAPALMIARPFELWERNFELGAFTSIPLLTYATRPLFASTRFPASVNKEEIEFLDYVKEGEIISFGNYFKWSTQFFLFYPLKNGNGLRLDYFWNYESYKAQNPVRTGEHSIMISTFFKI
ncbi:hypothetical protein SAMN05661096_02976 [Marivirga sericea]|uniref:Outer membrane protein beta-barrel domain-containing protein n=1 Tax=Marivirga sericea TaxID=1028 RepID=A0A1X7KNJ2_9BACT|nr:hypothetical protein [Marivirga sericea]SMG43107.1 hypothetical protein SAMN05661096_02976 [Marivirga sericea]